LKKIKYSQIKKLLKEHLLEINSDVEDDEYFNSIKTISNSTHNDLSFLSNIKYLNNLNKIQAKACLIEKKYVSFLPKSCKPIIVNDPYLALALLSNIFNDSNLPSNGIISKQTSINKDSKIHEHVQINPYSVVDKNTEIFENVYIGSNSCIGPNVVIHKNSIIHDNVTISNSIIMENCIIKSGSRIGGTGFGFEMKTKQKINHSGNVIIKRNSSIGSNTTIDRAVFDSTIIGEFSNIDNLVQIAHNVTIGNYAVIAAQVGIAGSTNIGNYLKVGGQAGISGHLNIGDNVTVAAKSGVTKNILDNKIVAGFPAKDINLWKKEIIRSAIKK
tara:strand:+ start:2127 stop:3113 length:987 start_codon:yes stop_codon:yes gene_type:complete